jgi:hypothetical protein
MSVFNTGSNAVILSIVGQKMDTLYIGIFDIQVIDPPPQYSPRGCVNYVGIPLPLRRTSLGFSSALERRVKPTCSA